MLKIGCHVSIAGGIVNAPERASALGCEVFQIFTRSPQGGSAPRLDAEVVKKFREAMEKWEQKDCYIHTPYYINFASANPATRKSSARIVREELERGSLIGAKYVVTHLGSSKDNSRDEALKITKKGIKEVLKGFKSSTQLLLEISAGSGNVIGDTFEELDYIVDGNHEIGICLDTAHMFASGYDIKTEKGFADTIALIRKNVGLDRIKLIHANDSKVGLRERKDRHDHIGDGKIGIDGLRNIMKAFGSVDLILETKPDKVATDIKLLKTLRGRSV